MKIIDTHLHTWDLENLDYYWLENDTSILSKSYFLSELEPQLQEANVTSAVLVQATNSLAESDWFLQLAKDNNFVDGAVIWLPLEDDTQFDSALDKYLNNPYFKGVRHQIHDEANAQWLLQPKVLNNLKKLAQHQIPYDLVGIKAAHIETAIALAKEIPDLKMVFDHLNQPPFTDKILWDEWEKLMVEASKFPNMYAKISGLGTTTTKLYNWNAEDILPAIECVLEHFTNEKVFCGGDWPVSLLAADYAFTWHQYQKVINQLLSPVEREKVYSSNAQSFYNLKS